MLQELNRAIDYIEEHLSDDLPLEVISEYVGVSDYHFRTVFFYLAGMTLSEYIKNRRLSEANKDLLTGEKVTDVAPSGCLLPITRSSTSPLFPSPKWINIKKITLIVKFGRRFGRNNRAEQMAASVA